jgi:putative ABC transport system permease protein
MNALRFILASLRHYRRIHVAVALGVAVATAVLTGALLVGDSVRGSLRDLTIQRLGRIDSVLVSAHMFRAELADELAANAAFKKNFTDAEPAILLNGTVQAGNGSNVRRATNVSIIGYPPEFWPLKSSRAGQETISSIISPKSPVSPVVTDSLVLTQTIAQELNIKTGDRVLLRIPLSGAIPADSSLGKKTDTSRGRTFTVAKVLPDEGLARFSLMPSQHLPRNVFMPLEAVQRMLNHHDKANAILVSTLNADQAAGSDAEGALRDALQPTLADLGLKVERFTLPIDCVQISADQLVLPDDAVRAAEKALPKTQIQPVVTYLANTLAATDGDPKKKTPYSTITGVDSTAQLGPLVDDRGQPVELAKDEIVLNRWAADDLGVKIGDRITVTYYEPESTHGQLREHAPPPVFKLRAIAELETADGKPTPAADPKLTPELPGVTDQKSISDWDLPFELVEKIRPQDEDYWDKYSTTPKAFISLATAKRLWPSRWGTISLLRVPVQTSNGETASATRRVEEGLLRELHPADLGMSFLPVKRLGLEAASGTTPFDALFLGFSFFLVASAVMLIALLFQLGVQQRFGELGTLTAVGLTPRQIAKLLGREGLAIAAIGAAFGVVAGVGYAWLMIFGLRTWWVAAIGTPFLQLHVTARSAALGWVIGVAVAWLTIRWSVRTFVRRPAAQLLAGDRFGVPRTAKSSPRSWFRVAVLIGLAAAITVLTSLGTRLHGEEQAGVFFGSGSLLLVFFLIVIHMLIIGSHRKTTPHIEFRLPMLSAINTARNPRRSTLTIGLVAAASFLIISVSAFHLDSGDAGTGGFDFIAKSDQPIHYDLNTLEGRREMGFSDAASRQLEDWRIYSLRVAAGEDASCLNLYRPAQPRVLGVPEALIKRGGFMWSDTKKDAGENPWQLLHAEIDKDEAGEPIVPIALDMSTAIYSLHLKGVGSRLTIRDAADHHVKLQVVGLLNNSVLQGNLLMSEANFLRLFPDTAGYRFFLIEQVGSPSRGGSRKMVHAASSRHAQADRTRSVPATLESALAEEGFDVVDAREQLASFLAVQNTYLSTFQSLGALGLLLGTVGLAVVQLRSVLERRGELALMRAEGFRRRRLVRMVVWENALLLLGGLAAGCMAAAVALIPQWAPHGASVPWLTLALLLGTIAVMGLAAGWLATRSALRAPILPALRGD